MIGRTYDEYRMLLRALPEAPRAVLEVGARPDATSLLCAPELSTAHYRVGVNAREPGRVDAVDILAMDARSLAFANATFDLVLCASTLEHIPDFWIARNEMIRVLTPGGTLILSVPGYGESAPGNYARRIGFALRMPDWWKRGTLTMRVHDAPEDYYRFSRQAVQTVLLRDLDAVRTWSIMMPPRIYGTGRKSGGANGASFPAHEP